MAERRAVRAIGSWLLLAAVVGALIVTADRAPAEDRGQEVDMALGAELYAFWCATCHGPQGRGMDGEGVMAGPRIDDSDVAYNDLLIRTGRMPIIEPRAGIVQEADFSDVERESLVAWMQEAFDLPGEAPRSPVVGDAALGGDLYAAHCASCHGVGGVGGVAGGGATVRPVRGLEPEAIVAATRVGPFSMPPFSEAVLDDEEVGHIAAFVTAMSQDTRSPLGFGEEHRVTAAVVAVPLGVAVLVVVFFAAKSGTRRGD